jgi:gas vesicle protein
MSEPAERRNWQPGPILAGALLGGILAGTLTAALIVSTRNRSVDDLRTEVKQLTKELSDLKHDLASRRGRIVPLVSQADRTRS